MFSQFCIYFALHILCNICSQLSADIYLRSKGNEASPIIIGRASAKVDENGFAGVKTTSFFFGRVRLTRNSILAEFSIMVIKVETVMTVQVLWA